MNASHLTTRWLLARSGVTSRFISSSERLVYADEVYAMVKKSYATIGVPVSSIGGLMKYDKWELFFSGDQLIAFNLYKTTPFGLKTGLIGSDGSSEGKSTVKSHIKTRYLRPNVYGEVSHAVEKLSAGAPIVCAVYVPDVIKKPIQIEEDGVHYSRDLEGVGWVTKKMVGRPKGVPVTSNPNVCPLDSGAPTRMASFERVFDEVDFDSHQACQIDVDTTPNLP